MFYINVLHYLSISLVVDKHRPKVENMIKTTNHEMSNICRISSEIDKVELSYGDRSGIRV